MTCSATTVRRAVLHTFVFLMLHAWVGAAARVPDEFGLDLVLDQAITHDGAADKRSTMTVFIRRDAGRWQRAVVLAANSNYHLGTIREATVTDSSVTLELSVALTSDPWVTGGHGRYQIQLTANDAGRLVGTFTGRYRLWDVAGRAEAIRHPPAKRYAAAVQATEHPRLLFRAEQIPALRKKLTDTEFGPQAVSKMHDPAGLAFRGLMTDNSDLFMQSQQATAALMADTSSGSKSVAHRVWSWRLFSIALAYDLAYHHWPLDFKKEVESYISEQAERHYFRHGTFTEYTSWSLTSRHAPNLLAGPALASLAIVGEPGPAPVQPVFAKQQADQPLVASTIRGENAVSPQPFLSDVMPQTWLWAGGYSEPQDKSDATLPFKELPKKGYWQGNISINDCNQNAWHTWNYFSTTINNDSQRWVRVEPGFKGGIDHFRMRIGDRTLQAGDVVTLGAGVHQLVVTALINTTNPWGKIFMRPRLQELTEEDAQRHLAYQQMVREDKQLDWQRAIEFHRQSGGASPTYQDHFEIGETLMYAIYRHAISSGGFQLGAKDSAFQLQSVMRYAWPYRIARGRDVSAFPDITHYLPRKIMPMVFAADGSMQVVPINGTADFQIQEWFENRNAGAEFFAHLYPITPARYQPAVRQAWHRLVGTDPTAILTGFAGKGNEVDFAKMNPHPVVAFVSYPVNEPSPATTPSLPLTWYAPDAGYALFRNRHQDANDIVVQAFANSLMAPNWRSENAGAVRIHGLGHTWLAGSDDHSGLRSMDSVVHVTSTQPLNYKATGQVTHIHQQADGGGAMTMNLDEIYASATRDHRGRPARLYSSFNGMRFDEHFLATGITGQRAIAVDYSGACGAPALIAMVDTVSGAKDQQWYHQLESRIEDYGTWEIVDAKGKVLKGKAMKKARVKGQSREILRDGFRYITKRSPKVPEQMQRRKDTYSVIADLSYSLHRGDASLRCTFAPSGDLRLSETTEQQFQKQLTGHSRAVRRIGSFRIQAEGADVFFCVFTLQRGPAPAVRVTGEGLDATFSVGEVQVRWDGQSIRIE